MPTLNIKKDLLMRKLTKSYSDEEFDDLCFKFGIELDEITSEKKMALKEKSATGKESDDVIYKIDIPANRYDLLSLESLVLALKIFTGLMQPPDYIVKQVNDKNHTISMNGKLKQVRPVIVAAVVRNIVLDQDLYNSFIDLQDKIHQNIGRKRSIVSIGTHDYDSIEGEFHYTTTRPNELKFQPLNQDREYTATELMELYADSHLKTYLPLIKDLPEYPVIYDAKSRVISMPPIINSEFSKISLNTKNIFIEITATDREKATIALDTVVSMLVSSSPDSAIVETVKINDLSDNQVLITPDMSYHKERVSVDYINRGLGIKIAPDEMARLLVKMGLKASVLANGSELEVHVPPTRHDIIHKCDIMEDVGIAYGYDNIAKTLPKSATIATQVPLNKLSDQVRQEVARCGYTEALNFALCSEDELSTMMRLPKESGNNETTGRSAVRIQNPKTAEFQVARTSLLPGLLKTLNSNKKLSLPMKLFEVGDVVLVDTERDVDARNERHLAAIYYGKQTSGFEVIHGLLDRVMQVLECPYIGDKSNKLDLERGYYLVCQDTGLYLNGRGAQIICNKKNIGSLGILHPEVLTNFELNHPSSALEITIEDLLVLK